MKLLSISGFCDKNVKLTLDAYRVVHDESAFVSVGHLATVDARIEEVDGVYLKKMEELVNEVKLQ